MPELEINVRQGEILNIVVSSYIMNSQPVSSLQIVQNFGIGLSSATIRSIFAELDNLGYLYSPHRSSGRIPTEKGYRFFAEHLAKRALSEEERKMIQAEYLRGSLNVEEIFEVTSRILGFLTDAVGVVLGPLPEQSVLKHIELIDMGEDEVLIVLVTRSGTVYSKTLFLEARIPRDYLHRISLYLNELYKGHDLQDVRQNLASQVDRQNEFRNYFPMVAKSIVANFDSVQGEEGLYTYGVDRLFQRLSREQHTRERSCDLGAVFDPQDFLKGILRESISLNDINITIEGDRDDRLCGLSIVSAGYRMGEKKIGSIGVVGPNRMEYDRVAGIVEYVSLLISGMITRISN